MIRKDPVKASSFTVGGRIVVGPSTPTSRHEDPIDRDFMQPDAPSPLSAKSSFDSPASTPSRRQRITEARRLLGMPDIVVPEPEDTVKSDLDELKAMMVEILTKTDDVQVAANIITTKFGSEQQIEDVVEEEKQNEESDNGTELT